MTPQLAAALARGAAVCLATGGLTCLTVYQQVGRWTPALVSGGAAFCSVVLSQLSVAGAVAGVRSARPPDGSAG